MFSRILIAVFLIISAGSYARAGLMGISETHSLDSQAVEEVLTSSSPFDESKNHNVDQRDSGDSLAMEIVNTGSSTSVGPGAVSSQSVFEKDSWSVAVALANDLLPPSPELDGILKPA